MLSKEQIWNRAAMADGGADPLEGDRALAAMLYVHGLVMNGGVAHALEQLSHGELTAGVSGFRYFGMAGAADLLAGAHRPIGESEDVLDAAYATEIPSDEALVRAFHLKYSESPEVFAAPASEVAVGEGLAAVRARTVTRGAVSTLLGSGALAGAVLLYELEFAALVAPLLSVPLALLIVIMASASIILAWSIRTTTLGRIGIVVSAVAVACLALAIEHVVTSEFPV